MRLLHPRQPGQATPPARWRRASIEAVGGAACRTGGAADQVRRTLGRDLAPILLLCPALALLMTAGLDDARASAALVLFALLAIPALMLGRRATNADARLLAGGLVMTAAILFEPTWHLAPLDELLYVPSEPLIAVVIAALFVSPTLGAFTALLTVGASRFSRPPRRLPETQAQLERRVAERTAELQETSRLLEMAQARIERDAERRANEMTRVIHDARNHLSQISAAAELLAMDLGAANDSSARLHGVIATSLQAHEELLDAVLEAALLEAGTLVLHRQPTDLAALARAAVEQAEPRYRQQHCALSFEQSAELPHVPCDERRMMRVLQTSLANALKYTASFRRRSGTVRVLLTREGDAALLRITDDGVGMSEDQLAHLHRRFVRSAEDGAAPEGIGVGLSASAGIIALHGGTLRLTSPGLGHGTTAEVRLPLAGAAP
jgi:signal transduction histidine kinase